MASFDPYEPTFQDDPYPTYRDLRSASPVYQDPSGRFWALTRFADVWGAVHDPGTFSSAGGMDIGDRPGEFMPTMITMDPPRHTALRAIVSRAFTPRRVESLRGRIEALCDELLADVGPGDDLDVVSTFSGPFPTVVIAELLGVPTSDLDRFKAWSDAVVAPGMHPEEARAAVGELHGYFAEILEARRQQPADDLITALLAADVDGERLSHEELLGFCFLLLVAGNETTTNLLSNAIVLLDRHPDQRRVLAGDPDAVPAAVEEILRYEPPVQGLARTLRREVAIEGNRLGEGEKVLLLYAAANRDPHEFPDPDRFDVARRPERHLAFGHGIHYCLGAPLARLEATIALRSLLARLGDYEVDAAGVERVHSWPMRGCVRLPVRAAVGVAR